MKYYLKTQHIDRSENITIRMHKSNINCPVHTHDFIEFVFVLEGQTIQNIDGNRYELGRGGMVFINANQRHSFEVLENCVYVNILLNPKFVSKEFVDSTNAQEIFSFILMSEWDENSDDIFPLFFDEELFDEANRIIEIMLKEFNEKKHGYCTILNGYFRILLGIVFRAMDSSGVTTLAMSEIIPEILDFINTNIASNVTLSMLASKYFYNPSYFSRYFKYNCGITLSQYIQQKRVEKAYHMILETKLPIEKIAFSVGYNSEKQFYRAFKKHYGDSPSSVRRRSESKYISD